LSFGGKNMKRGRENKKRVTRGGKNIIFRRGREINIIFGSKYRPLNFPIDDQIMLAIVRPILSLKKGNGRKIWYYLWPIILHTELDGTIAALQDVPGIVRTFPKQIYKLNLRMFSKLSHPNGCFHRRSLGTILKQASVSSPGFEPT
jgi:hypothetical protein